MDNSLDLEFVTWDKLISENRWYIEQSDVVNKHNRMKETKNVNARERNDPRGNSHVITGRWDGSTTNRINTYSHNCREKVSELTINVKLRRIILRMGPRIDDNKTKGHGSIIKKPEKSQVRIMNSVLARLRT